MTDEQLRACMQRLGIGSRDLQRVQGAPTYEAATKRLWALQRTVHRNFKRVALELHPDLHPDDPEKEEVFKQLREVVEWVEDLKLAPPPPPRPRIHPMSLLMGGIYPGTSTTSTTSDYGSGSVVITIKV